MLATLEYLEVDESAKREAVIKFGGDPKMWRKARFWTMLEHEQNLVWCKSLEALKGML